METNYLSLAGTFMKAFLFDLKLDLDGSYFSECALISISNNSVCWKRPVQTFVTSIWKAFVCIIYGFHADS